jgi:hypothetical protein
VDLIPRTRASARTGAKIAPIPVFAIVKTFSKPRWFGLHLVVLAVSVAMILLGRWQLDVSNTKHFDLQNFGYALQWWAFTAFGLLLWLRFMRDQLRPANTGTVASTSGALVVKAGEPSVRFGPALLVGQAGPGEQSPTLYRGYALPNSAAAPARSEDRFHGSYNDYLWELGLADKAEQDRRAGP